MSKNAHNSLITIPDAPDIQGLTFRHFRGESDYTHMVAVIEQYKQEDRFEQTITTEDKAAFSSIWSTVTRTQICCLQK